MPRAVAKTREERGGEKLLRGNPVIARAAL
jgi:hypothetical protein